MEKINKIRRFFKKFKLDGYIIPKNDKFFSEYVDSDQDKLKYVTNFSGSYGFAIILKKKNYLFVDGRYTEQAKKQSGKKFQIVTIPKHLPYNILGKKKLLIGFDPSLHTELSLKSIFSKTKCLLIPIEDNFVNKIWKRKKIKNVKKLYVLKKNESGKSYNSKINCIKRIIDKKVDCYFITAPENVSWTLNIRGFDCEFSPLVKSYLIIQNGKVNFFCDLKKINDKIKKSLNNIKIIDIKNTKFYLSSIKNKIVQIDKSSCSILFSKILKKNNKVIEIHDPIYLLKSIKNKTEIQNTIRSHIFDGAALTKFLIWLKNNYKNKRITEISAQEKLLKLRKLNKNFKSLSFPTISGSGPNASIIHYKANLKSNRVLKNKDLYLVDSGGQYNFGTTDVTRTISLDNNDKKIKDIYTRVLKGHIAVANYKISKNTSGSEIDSSARKFLKEINLDYAHGTGHGVGYFLNVHEGPHAISKNNKISFQKGMIVSNEPGYYEKNKFGIRIENLIYVKGDRNKLRFENLTMAPIDKDLIIKKNLNENEKKWLNNYHKTVFRNLKKFMNRIERLELKKACSAI